MAVAARIRVARRAAGLSQHQLAERLGIRRAAVTQWESAAGTLPSTINLLRTAAETGVSFEWLALGRGTMRPDTGEAVAFSVKCVAQSPEEECLLDLFRRCNLKQRVALLDLLRTVSPDRRALR
jgi:transcriptional regulator with XRE-family HTH domain